MSRVRLILIKEAKYARHWWSIDCDQFAFECRSAEPQQKSIDAADGSHAVIERLANQLRGRRPFGTFDLDAVDLASARLRPGQPQYPGRQQRRDGCRRFAADDDDDLAARSQFVDRSSIGHDVRYRQAQPSG